MKNPSVTLLDSIFRFLLGVFLVALPLAYWSGLFTPTLPRTALVIGMGMIALFFLVVRWVLLGQIAITVTPFTVPMLLFTAVSVASRTIGHGPFVEGLYGPVGETLAAFAIFLTAVETGVPSLLPVSLGVTIMALLHLESVFGVMRGVGVVRGISETGPSFSTFGNPWVSIGVMGYGSMVGFVQFFRRRRIPYLLLALLPAAAVLATVVALLREPLMVRFTPPVSASWVVAVETLRTRPLLGVGSGLYETGFTAGRPISMNAVTGWDQPYQHGFSEILTLMTELGLLGVVIVTFLVTRVFTTTATALSIGKNDQERQEVALWVISTVLLFILMLLVPVRTVGWAYLAITLAGIARFMSDRRLLSVFLPFSSSSRVDTHGRITASHLVVIVVALVTLALGIGTIGKAVAADYWMKQSLALGEQGKGSETYRLQGDAVSERPTNSSYRLTFASTNLRVADALIRARISTTGNTGTTSTTGKTLSDEDRQTVQKLLSDAIEQAKQVTAEYPDLSRGWRMLADIYRAVINVTDSASGLALEAYREALVRDPTNPQLYLDRGTVSYAVGNYDLAVEDFRRAISLKNDWATGWLRLGEAYEKTGKTDWSNQAYQQAMRLSGEGSTEYEKAAAALGQRGGESPESSPSPTPEPSSTPILTSTLTPTQTPTPEPTITPSPTMEPSATPTMVP